MQHVPPPPFFSRMPGDLPSGTDKYQALDTYTGQSRGTIVKYASHFHFFDGLTSLTL